MKYKIKIVDSLKEYNKDINRRLKTGELEKKPERALVMTPAVFSKVFSPERMRLLRTLHRSGKKNIYQLAKDLDNSRSQCPIQSNEYTLPDPGWSQN